MKAEEIRDGEVKKRERGERERARAERARGESRERRTGREVEKGRRRKASFCLVTQRRDHWEGGSFKCHCHCCHEPGVPVAVVLGCADWSGRSRLEHLTVVPVAVHHNCAACHGLAPAPRLSPLVLSTAGLSDGKSTGSLGGMYPVGT